jgi:hypothetical protein
MTKGHDTNQIIDLLKQRDMTARELATDLHTSVNNVNTTITYATLRDGSRVYEYERPTKKGTVICFGWLHD